MQGPPGSVPPSAQAPALPVLIPGPVSTLSPADHFLCPSSIPLARSLTVMAQKPVEEVSTRDRCDGSGGAQVCLTGDSPAPWVAREGGSVFQTPLGEPLGGGPAGQCSGLPMAPHRSLFPYVNKVWDLGFWPCPGPCLHIPEVSAEFCHLSSNTQLFLIIPPLELNRPSPRSQHRAWLISFTGHLLSPPVCAATSLTASNPSADPALTGPGRWSRAGCSVPARRLC